MEKIIWKYFWLVGYLLQAQEGVYLNPSHKLIKNGTNCAVFDAQIEETS